MAELDDVFSCYNEEKIKEPIPVLFADSKIGRETIKYLKECGIKCGYIKVPVIASENLKEAQKILRCIYPEPPKGE